MRIKKEFLNLKSLRRYGFKQEFPYPDCKTICEYTKKCRWSEVLIQRGSGEIAIVITDSDTANIDDTVYHLIRDGLVEI